MMVSTTWTWRKKTHPQLSVVSCHPTSEANEVAPGTTIRRRAGAEQQPSSHTTAKCAAMLDMGWVKACLAAEPDLSLKLSANATTLAQRREAHAQDVAASSSSALIATQVSDAVSASSAANSSRAMPTLPNATMTAMNVAVA